MLINSLYPVICTDKVLESKTFYMDYFDLELTFEADWYISMRTKHEPHFELALLDYRHESIPDGFRIPTKGALINIEVPDVDAVYGRLSTAGLPMVRDIRSEAFGQRHFIIKDPSDLLVDVIQNIEPSEDFADQYT